ncbi:MAG: glutathione peroxidase [Micavibrio sp.]|nr:glutathione peroxidase [Micavibrio sp.]
MTSPLYSIPLKKIDGTPASLKDYAGKALLIVNVASKCGLTKQYEGLEKLYADKKAEGLEVLGFPANEFAGQEPGSNGEIAEFCRATFGVEFPMFEKIVVKGDGQHPLYQALTTAVPEAQGPADSMLKKKLIEKGLYNAKPGEVMWNFEKFLVSRNGDVVARFAPDVTPEDPMLQQALAKELAKK